MSAWIVCPCCTGPVTQLHFFVWCDDCWYTVCGGDLSSDWDLNRIPEVILS